MKKKLTAIILVCVMMVSLLPVIAYAKSGSCGENVSYSLEDDVLTIYGTGDMADYSFDKTKRAPWYATESTIKEVIIEDGVTSIGNYAFAYCHVLEKVTIPDSVAKIGNNAFYLDYELQDFTIPENVSEIGFSAFYSCRKLKHMEIPEKVESISYIFEYCENLESITIPKT